IYNRGSGRSVQEENPGPQHYPRQVKGGDIGQIRHVAERLSPRAVSGDRSGWGRAQVDSLSGVSVRSFGSERTRVPDVRGMGLKDALFLLENCGLSVRFSGQGTVVAQSIAPGTLLGNYKTIEIRLQ
ncbi:MAG: PASTA domain-containing protein, partial [Alistipes sp.]|nr:PASTA domain-containing protein [Alistipes sp.]